MNIFAQKYLFSSLPETESRPMAVWKLSQKKSHLPTPSIIYSGKRLFNFMDVERHVAVASLTASNEAKHKKDMFQVIVDLMDWNSIWSTYQRRDSTLFSLRLRNLQQPKTTKKNRTNALAEHSEVPNGSEEENHCAPQWWLDVYHRQMDINTPKR